MKWADQMKRDAAARLREALCEAPGLCRALERVVNVACSGGDRGHPAQVGPQRVGHILGANAIPRQPAEVSAL